MLESFPEILSASMIAKYLAISRVKVYELFKRTPAVGGIPNFDIGATKRVRKTDFIAWLDESVNRKTNLDRSCL